MNVSACLYGRLWRQNRDKYYHNYETLVNIAKQLRRAFLTEHLRRLLCGTRCSTPFPLLGFTLCYSLFRNNYCYICIVPDQFSFLFLFFFLLPFSFIGASLITCEKKQYSEIIQGISKKIFMTNVESHFALDIFLEIYF